MSSRLLLVAALTAMALVLAPGAASAAPPVNDNYLSSTSLNQPGTPLGAELTDTVDTTEATVQDDLFNPAANGQPLGGTGRETTACGATGYGKTVWYDFHPDVDGDAHITTAGFDAVVTVYEWNLQDSRITRTVTCHNAPGPAESFDLLNLKGGTSYTVQVGGVTGPAGPAGGTLAFSLDFLGNADGDSRYDAEDDCPTIPGIASAGGCPPQLNLSSSLNYVRAGASVSISKFIIGRVPKGAKVVARCAGCGTQTIKARRTGTYALDRLVGRSLRPGTTVEVKVTLAPTGKPGKYRYGALGKRIRWPVQARGIGSKTERCLNVKGTKVQRCP